MIDVFGVIRCSGRDKSGQSTFHSRRFQERRLACADLFPVSTRISASQNAFIDSVPFNKQLITAIVKVITAADDALSWGIPASLWPNETVFPYQTSSAIVIDPAAYGAVGEAIVSIRLNDKLNNRLLVFRRLI